MKGLAIFCVVLGHVPYAYAWRDMLNEHEAYILFSIANIIYAFHMPLMMMLSGYAYRYAYFDADGNAKKRRIYRQAANLMLMYIIFSVGYVLLRSLFKNFLVQDLPVSALLMIWIKPIYICWYLYALAVFTLFFSLDRIRNANKWLLPVVTALLAVLADFLPISDLILYEILAFAVFFYIGLRHCAEPGSQRRNSWVAWISFFISVLMLAVFWQYHPAANFEGAHRLSDIPVVRVVAAFGFCAALWRLFEKSPVLGENRLLIFLGRHSLEIYLIHNLVNHALAVVFTKIGMALWSSVLLNVLLGIVCPILIAAICKKIKIYDFLFKPIILFEKAQKIQN